MMPKVCGSVVKGSLVFLIMINPVFYWGRGLTGTLQDGSCCSVDQDNRLTRGDRLWEGSFPAVHRVLLLMVEMVAVPRHLECLHCGFMSTLGFYTNCGLRPCHLRAVILDLLSSNRLSHESTSTVLYCCGLRSAPRRVRTLEMCWECSPRGWVCGRGDVPVPYSAVVTDPDFLWVVSEVRK